jgi:hypothetical protein
METQINSADIISISKNLNTMYNNYIIDNKYILSYLKDVTDTSLANSLFNKYIQLLLTSELSSGNLLFVDTTKFSASTTFPNSNTINAKNILKSNAIEFIDSLYIIYQIYKKIYDYVNTNIDAIDTITTITLTFVSVDQTPEYTSGSGNTGTLNISIDKTNLSSSSYTLSPNSFSKTTNPPTSYMTLSSTNINVNTIVNNYIYYIFNIKSTNAKLQLLSIYNIMNLFINSFKLRVGYELIISAATPITSVNYDNICASYITPAHSTIKTLIDNTNITLGGSITPIENIIIGDLVPSTKNDTFVIKALAEDSTTIDIDYSNDYKNKSLLLELISDANKVAYEIYKINHSGIPNNDKITSIVLKDIGNDFYSQYKNSTNSSARFRIREKGINDFKLKYMETGIALRDINKYIDDYKKEINRNVDVYTKNKNKSKNLHFHSRLYYIIFILLFLMTLFISLNNYEKNTKITALILFIAIAISMIIYNHNANDYYISDYFNINEDKIDFANADMQTKSFYIICAILIIGVIALSLTIGIILTIDISKLITITIFISICLIVSLIIYKHVSLEKFSIKEKFGTSQTANIANIGTCPTLGTSTSDKINYAQNGLNVYNSNVLIYVSNLIAYIPSIETKDLYGKITDSIDNEKKSFASIQKEYYMRNKQTLESTNLLKHNIISNYSYIIMISYLYLILILIYFAYLIEPLYIKSYLFIGAFIYFFVLWIYYVNIVQPVRVRSSNKYWIKPSENTLIQSGI